MENTSEASDWELLFQLDEMNETYTSSEDAGDPGTLSYDFITRIMDPYKDFGDRMALIVTYVVIFAACFFGNLLVLCVITRKTRNRTRTDIFMGNLALADLLVGVFCVLPNLCRNLFHRWLLGKFLCKLHQYVQSVNMTASMFLLEVIAVERYIVIRHPLRARSLLTRNKVYFAQVFIWLVSAGYNVPLISMYELHIFSFNETNVTEAFCYQRHDSGIDIFNVPTFLIWYFCPLVVMMVLYLQIIRTLWRGPLRIDMVSSSRRACSPISPTALTSFSSGSTRESIQDMSSSVTSNIKDMYERESSFSMDTGSSDSNKESFVLKSISKSNSRPISAFGRPKHSLEMESVAPLPSTSQLPTKKLRIFKATMKPENFAKGHVSASSNPQKSERVAKRKHTQTSLDSNRSSTTNNDEDFSISEESDAGDRIEQDPLDGHKPHQKGKKKRKQTGDTAQKYDLSLCYVTSLRVSRRRVIRLLIVVLLTFAILILPNQMRLLMISCRVYIQSSLSSALFALVCQVLVYLNSAVNPILYSIMSRNFRHSLREVMSNCCLSRAKRGEALYLARRKSSRATIPQSRSLHLNQRTY